MIQEYHVVKVSETPAELSVCSIFSTTTPWGPIITSGTRETIVVIITPGVDVGGANFRWVEYTIEFCGIASFDGVFVVGSVFTVGTSDTTSSNDNGAAVTSSVTATVAVMTVSRGPRELTRGAALILARHRAKVMSLLRTRMVFSPDGVDMCVVIGVRCMDEMKTRDSNGLGAFMVVQRDFERKS